MQTSKKQLTVRNYLVTGAAIVAACALSIGALGMLRADATSSVAFSNTFETDIADWNSGLVERVASGTDGIASAGGGFHGIAKGDAVAPHAGPHTKLGGYSSTWSNEWGTSIDVYLDPAWATDTGFIYSAGINTADGTKSLRDYTMTIGVLNDASTGNVDKLVAAPSFEGLRDGDALYQLKRSPARPRVEVTTAGWYTIDYSFRNVDGTLYSITSLSTASGTVLKSWINNELPAAEEAARVPDAIPSEVGGNRYGWFTHITVPGGVAIDNVTRTTTTNEFTVPADATTPMDLTVEDGKTVTITGAVGGSVVTPADLTLTGASTGVTITIPSSTTITAADSNWSGTLDTPAVDTTKSVTVDGKTYDVSAAYKVGSSSPLEFSNPVKVTLPGQAGKHAGYLDNDAVFHAITTQCATDPATTLVGAVKECYTTEGDDLVIWTTHFSVFLAYDATPSVGAPNTGLNPTNMTVVSIALAAGIVGLLALAASTRRTAHAPYRKK